MDSLMALFYSLALSSNNRNEAWARKFDWTIKDHHKLMRLHLNLFLLNDAVKYDEHQKII